MDPRLDLLLEQRNLCLGMESKMTGMLEYVPAVQLCEQKEVSTRSMNLILYLRYTVKDRLNNVHKEG